MKTPRGDRGEPARGKAWVRSPPRRHFRTTFVVFGGLVALGFALIYALRREWSTGLGVALVLASGIGLAVDSVAERRAHPYVAALEQLARDSAR